MSKISQDVLYKLDETGGISKRRKSTKVNRKSKFKNKLDRKAWRRLYAARPWTAALRTYVWIKNRERLGL